MDKYKCHKNDVNNKLYEEKYIRDVFWFFIYFLIFKFWSLLAGTTRLPNSSLIISLVLCVGVSCQEAVPTHNWVDIHTTSQRNKCNLVGCMVGNATNTCTGCTGAPQLVIAQSPSHCLKPHSDGLVLQTMWWMGLTPEPYAKRNNLRRARPLSNLRKIVTYDLYCSLPPGDNQDVFCLIWGSSKTTTLPHGDEKVSAFPLIRLSHCNLSVIQALLQLCTLIHWWIDWTVLITWILPIKPAALVHILPWDLIQSRWFIQLRINFLNGFTDLFQGNMSHHTMYIHDSYIIESDFPITCSLMSAGWGISKHFQSADVEM